jgi:hypothetical protein
MAKVIMFSDMYLPTFPWLDLNLYNKLVERKIPVNYVLNEKDYRFSGGEMKEVYGAISDIVKKDSDVLSIIDKDDLLVMRFAYKGIGGDIANKARSMGRKILMLDPAAVDLKHRSCPAQYITAKSEWMKQQTLKAFPGIYKDIFVTGTIHFDDAATVQVNKEQFMKSYGLDHNKKLAIVCKASPGEIGHQYGVDEEYIEIVNILKSKCPDYEFLFKAHPLDYTAEIDKKWAGVIHKGEHYQEKPSYKILFSGINVVKAEEGYMAMKACDIVLNVRSSIAMETPLFPKPIININRNKYLTNWPFDASVMHDINIVQLEYYLNNNKYSIDTIAAKKYCERYCYSDDGKSYVRTADAIMKLLWKGI